MSARGRQTRPAPGTRGLAGLGDADAPAASLRFEVRRKPLLANPGKPLNERQDGTGPGARSQKNLNTTLDKATHRLGGLP